MGGVGSGSLPWKRGGACCTGYKWWGCDLWVWSSFHGNSSQNLLRLTDVRHNMVARLEELNRDLSESTVSNVSSL